ncbi:MAG TPA: cyclic nucleotide-binding domain-containing protein [Burkholderiales bacterium]|nr:cyclic nucleotide-binding domain-containing protein [Burkholderiales bacterium]
MAEAGAQNLMLKQLEPLGSGTDQIEAIRAMVGHTRFFDDLQAEDLGQLVAFMHAYRAQPGETLIREGDIDDYMLLIIRGKVDIVKTDKRGVRQPMTSAGPGTVLGEMSMIDGEPRFASCIAAETTVFATLSRDAMVRIVLEAPGLGAKLLIKLVTLLSTRLRQTSATLLHYMER